jgi:hypothetical protein
MHQKMHSASAARSLLQNLRMHASLPYVVLNHNYKNSDQIFGALTEFL